MGHLYHGYVTNNQRVTVEAFFNRSWSKNGVQQENSPWQPHCRFHSSVPVVRADEKRRTRPGYCNVTVNAATNQIWTISSTKMRLLYKMIWDVYLRIVGLVMVHYYSHSFKVYIYNGDVTLHEDFLSRNGPQMVDFPYLPWFSGVWTLNAMGTWRVPTFTIM